MSNTLNLGSGDWATKDNSLLGYNSENGNFKPLPFNFSRGSLATVINKQGLIETVQANNARVDYLDNAKGALLLETQRTNSLLQSNQFDNAVWNKGTGTVVTNTSISPDGTLNGSRYNVVGTSSFAYLSQSFSANASQDYTYSIWVKKVSGSGILKLAISDVALATVTSANINLTTEFVRYSFTIASGDLSNTGYIGAGFVNVTNGDVIEVYGAQLEEGSYATSYIPTQGTVQTRLADVCSQTPPDGVIGQTEGSIFIELDVNSRVLSSSWAFSLNDGTTSNYIGLRRSGGAEFFAHINVSGTTTALISTGITNGKNKISIGYASNDIIVYVNGVNVGGDTSSNIPTTSDLQIGNLISNRTLEDSVSGFKLYNTRLSNSELAALTTI